MSSKSAQITLTFTFNKPIILVNPTRNTSPIGQFTSLPTPLVILSTQCQLHWSVHLLTPNYIGPSTCCPPLVSPLTNRQHYWLFHLLTADFIGQSIYTLPTPLVSPNTLDKMSIEIETQIIWNFKTWIFFQCYIFPFQCN